MLQKCIFAFVNQKGGSGKTTTAVHFAYWLSQRDRSVLFVDADPQESARPWVENLGLPVSVLPNPDDLLEKVTVLAEQYDAVIIDAPANASEPARAILSVADIAIVPNRASNLDLTSASAIIRYIQQLNSPKLRNGSLKAVTFVNAAKEKTVLLREAREALESYPVPLLKTCIHNWACVTDAPGQGNTVFQMSGTTAKKAAIAYDSLFSEVLEAVQ